MNIENTISVLNYAIENGIIELDTIIQKASMYERKQYLEEHINHIQVLLQR